MRDIIELDYVEQLDNLKYSISSRPIFVHTHHRWVLSILHWAQQRSYLHKPCTIVSLDAHRDWSYYFSTTNRNARDTMISDGVTHILLKQYLRNECVIDDQWLVSGVDFGLIGDSLLIGGQADIHASRPSWLECDPNEDSGEVFTYLAKTSHVKSARRVSVLDTWTLMTSGGYDYPAILTSLDPAIQRRWNRCYRDIVEIDNKSLFLTIDLDFFIDYENEILYSEKDVESLLAIEIRGDGNTNSLSVGDIFERLASRAAVVAIATEPKHCYGPKNSAKALEMADAFLELNLPPDLKI